ncbi:MAG TPA: hypothetical protein ENN38_01520 [Actinobacteria bacterium]|nr:hypothetical protein [Actinomycetota bacterium]
MGGELFQRKILSVSVPLIATFLATFCVNLYSRSNIPIIVYHNVKNGIVSEKSYIDISKNNLETHLKYISQNFEAITYDELLAYHNKDLRFKNKKPILITFDDGLLSVYKYAYPLALKYNIKFTIAYFPGKYEPLAKVNKITWQQLKEMKESKIVEVASHSYDHVDLTTLEKN